MGHPYWSLLYSCTADTMANCRALSSTVLWNIKKLLKEMHIFLWKEIFHLHYFLFFIDWLGKPLPSCWSQKPRDCLPHDWCAYSWWEIPCPHQWPSGLRRNSRPLPWRWGGKHCFHSQEWGERPRAWGWVVIWKRIVDQG